VVDRDGVVRAAVAVVRGEKEDKRARAKTEQVNAFAAAFNVGDVVLVSVREVGDAGAVCDLELRPELQGASLVARDGRIVAMVGGNDNKNFNRATALRQMGSTWKPLVFHAAMELGWRPDDVLDNRRGVFPFSTTFYYPRPDHEPEPEVSMAWAGVRSENLASIWLLYHLSDRLNGEQVRVLAAALDMARREGESAQEYRTRIQTMGVLPTRARVKEALFLQAREEVLGGLAFSDHPEDAIPLQSLHYGWGFSSELGRVERAGGSQRLAKVRALAGSFTTLNPMVESCAVQHRALSRSIRSGQLPTRQRIPDLSVMLDDDRVHVACGAIPEGYAAPDRTVFEALREGRGGGPLLGRVRLPSRRGVELDDKSEMLLDGRLHLATMETLRRAWKRRMLAVETAGTRDLYDPELLYWHQDFRVLLGMRYVTQLAAQYGVRTDVNELLSLPLGASEITLEESVSLYGGLTTSTAWTFPGVADGAPTASPTQPLLLISRVEDVDGVVLYEAKPESRQVTAEKVGDMTADILRNVILWGTGRRAKGLISEKGKQVPIGGKTGTTNDFRNAAFLGFAPVADGAGFDTTGGFVVGTYVGYDDNRPMVTGNLKLAGASGALPAWMGAVDGLHDGRLLGTPPWDSQQKTWPLTVASRLERVAVGETGLAVAEVAVSDGAPSMLVPQTARLERPLRVSFRKKPRRVRIAPRTAEAQELERKRREALERLRERPSIWDPR
jgi:hypothetical protein